MIDAVAITIVGVVGISATLTAATTSAIAVAIHSVALLQIKLFLMKIVYIFRGLCVICDVTIDFLLDLNMPPCQAQQSQLELAG